VTQLRQRLAGANQSDAEVLVIGFEAARRVGGFCRRYDIPFRCLVDEPRSVYRAYGMGRASWLRTLTPRAIAPYLRHMMNGQPVRRRHDQDVRQRGGDFVVGPEGLLRLAYVSDDPADRPSVDAILAQIS